MTIRKELRSSSSAPAAITPKTYRSSFGLLGALLAVYLGTSNVYWFANLPVKGIALAKLMLAGCTVTGWFMLASKGRPLSLPAGFFSPAGFLVLLLSLTPGIVQSSGVEIVVSVTDLAYGFAFLWTCYLYVAYGQDIIRAFVLATAILLAFSCLVVIAGVTGYPDWKSPFLEEGFTLSDTGFGGVRTGWSNGVALFVPIALWAAASGKNNFGWYLVARIAMWCGPLIGSQVVVGGRAGLFASLAVLAGWVAYGRKKLWLAGLLAVLATAGAMQWDWISEHLRFQHLEADKSGVDNWDAFSAGRIELDSLALRLIADQPFTGYGFDDLEAMHTDYADMVHNLWLRLAVQAGVLAPIVFALFVASYGKILLSLTRAPTPMSTAWCRNGANFAVAILGVYVIAVVLTMVEPRVILGAFQNWAIWWATAGAALGFRRRLQEHTRI